MKICCPKGRRDPPCLKYIDKERLQKCGILRQVNKAFYYSATRLMFQTFVIKLDRKVQGGHFPFIKFEELCRNGNARYLQTLVIKCRDKLSKAAASQNLGDFAGSCKRFALRLKQFPSLREVVLVLFKYNYGSHAMEAADQIEQIVDALALAQLPKLESLGICYDGSAEGMSDYDLLKSPLSTPSPMSRSIKSLRNLSLGLGCSRLLCRKQGAGIRQILEHAENLESVYAHGIYKLPRSSPTLICPSAPLRSLVLTSSGMPGECLLELRHFRNTLRHLELKNVMLNRHSSRTWAEFFILLQQFSALDRLKVEKCGYRRIREFMTVSDRHALLQYKAHCVQTRGKTGLKPHLRSVTIDVRRCW